MDELIGEMSLDDRSSVEGCSTTSSELGLSKETNIWDACHILKNRARFYDKIDQYFKEETYTNVNIICGGQTFKCHRLALAAASEYFHRMFRGNFVESKAEDVVLRDINSDTFKQILLYVYRGEIAAIDDDNVLSLLRASDILELSYIEDYCIHYLTQRSIPKKDALEIYLFASASHKVSLIPATCKFILEHLDRFRRESMFLQMSLEDFSTLLTYFQTSSSATQETRLLSAILCWVRHSTDVRENRKAYFTELAGQVEFRFVSAAYVSEYFDTKSADERHDDEQVTEASNVMHSSSEIGGESSPSLHVYVKTDMMLGPVNSIANQSTNIFSLQEKIDGDTAWHHSCAPISPAIQSIRTVESDGRLYSLKLHDKRYTFSSSTAIDLRTDVRSLALPSGLAATFRPSVLTDAVRDRLAPFSFYRFRENIYLSSWHADDIGFQCYNTELDAWSAPVSIPSEYKFENVVGDDTRLYLTEREEFSSRTFFAAYDPRVGRVEHLNDEGLRCLAGCTEPACYHKGRIYLAESDLGQRYMHAFRMAIYDPVAGRWDVQNLKSRFVLFSWGRRLVSFNNLLWMFGLDGAIIYTQTYDSYVQRWNYWCPSKLYRAFVELKRRMCTDFMDVVVF